MSRRSLWVVLLLSLLCWGFVWGCFYMVAALVGTTLGALVVFLGT
jgi:hypothetical protein